MKLMLEITDGELKGQTFLIQDAVSIGRKNCKINILDPKISSHHADIRMRGSGQFFLVDNQSSNGIKVNDVKVPELALVAGVEFRLGRTYFRVLADLEVTPMPPLAEEKVGKAKFKPQSNLNSPPPLPSNETQAPLEPNIPNPPKELSWQETLVEFLRSAQARAENFPVLEIKAFNPPVKLSFVGGIQFGETWKLGYGPRIVGAKSVDLQLIESGVPDYAFRLSPQKAGVHFSTDFSNIVRINGKSVENEILQDGDVIEINDTRIMVSTYGS